MNSTFSQSLPHINIRRGWAFGILIIGALIAFEIFNYSTTDFALNDLLGDLRFLGVRWATILALAFCGIDFAGIARLFTPEQGAEEPAEVWYLFGAWMLAAAMNALLTWWGVSIAILSHESLGRAVVERETLMRVVPVFVALMVWVIRVLIIGSFSVAGERLFSQGNRRAHSNNRAAGIHMPGTNRQSSPMRPLAQPTSAPSYRPAPKEYTPVEHTQSYSSPRSYHSPERNQVRPEPTYHPMSMNGANPTQHDRMRR